MVAVVPVHEAPPQFPELLREVPVHVLAPHAAQDLPLTGEDQRFHVPEQLAPIIQANVPSIEVGEPPAAEQSAAV